MKFTIIQWLKPVAVVVAMLTASHASAELYATPLRGDARLVQFQYDQDNTYLVLAKPKAVTHLQFAGDEVIQSVAAGDTKAWEFTPTKNRRNMFIKPIYEDTETSVSVLTDKRVYQFVLRSTGDGKKWYQRVNWLYGSEIILEDLSDVGAEAKDIKIQEAKLSSINTGSKTIDAAKLRFNYEIDGDAPFKPMVAFDDGTFTYLSMPEKLQELPALFILDGDSSYALVNYTVDGNYLVAQRLIQTAVLKLGKEEVKIKRIDQPKSFFNFGSNR